MLVEGGRGYELSQKAAVVLCCGTVVARKKSRKSGWYFLQRRCRCELLLDVLDVCWRRLALFLQLLAFDSTELGRMVGTCC